LFVQVAARAGEAPRPRAASQAPAGIANLPTSSARSTRVRAAALGAWLQSGPALGLRVEASPGSAGAILGIAAPAGGAVGGLPAVQCSDTRIVRTPTPCRAAQALHQAERWTAAHAWDRRAGTGPEVSWRWSLEACLRPCHRRDDPLGQDCEAACLVS